MALRQILVVGSLFWASVAQAHALDLSVARVTLRDAHVEVMLELDPFLLAGADPTAVATASEKELIARLQHARRVLESETKLKVDGAPVGLVLRGFPAPSEFRAMAATLSAAQKDHGDPVRLRLEAPQPVLGASSVALSLPAVLGPSVVSFVQPTTRYAAPGESLPFAVLRAPYGQLHRRSHSDWLGLGLGGALAAAALACMWIMNRQKKDGQNLCTYDRR